MLLHIKTVGSNANGLYVDVSGITIGGAVLYNYATSLGGLLDDNASVLT